MPPPTPYCVVSTQPQHGRENTPQPAYTYQYQKTGMLTCVVLWCAVLCCVVLCCVVLCCVVLCCVVLSTTESGTRGRIKLITQPLTKTHKSCVAWDPWHVMYSIEGSPLSVGANDASSTCSQLSMFCLLAYCQRGRIAIQPAGKPTQAIPTAARHPTDPHHPRHATKAPTSPRHTRAILASGRTGGKWAP